VFGVTYNVPDISGLMGQPDISTLIRSLAVEAKAEVLGRSFQGKAAIRVLGESDHMRLLAYAEPLPLEPRARLLPEERLEALLLAGDENAVARLLQDEPVGIADERRRYLMTQAARHLRERSGGPASSANRWRKGGVARVAHHFNLKVHFCATAPPT
jgi:hypothetical protein